MQRGLEYETMARDSVDCFGDNSIRHIHRSDAPTRGHNSLDEVRDMRQNGLSSYWWNKLKADPDWQIAEYFYELRSSERTYQELKGAIPIFAILGLITGIMIAYRWNEEHRNEPCPLFEARP
jgi:hypothetical protein